MGVLFLKHWIHHWAQQKQIANFCQIRLYHFPSNESGKVKALPMYVPDHQTCDRRRRVSCLHSPGKRKKLRLLCGLYEWEQSSFFPRSEWKSKIIHQKKTSYHTVKKIYFFRKSSIYCDGTQRGHGVLQRERAVGSTEIWWPNSWLIRNSLFVPVAVKKSLLRNRRGCWK